MKEQYIKQVMRALSGQGARKREVQRDLQEIFDSAHEHGQTDLQVIERLGAPEDFAQSILGEQKVQRKGRWRWVVIGFLLFVVAVCGILLWVIQASRLPDHVIGYQDSMTSIQITGAFDITPILWGVGAVALAVAVGFILWGRKRKK